MDNTPIIGITMGDPCGIGPEVTVRSLIHPEIVQHCRPLIVGSIGVCKRAAAVTGTKLSFRSVQDPTDAEFTQGTIDVLDIPCDLDSVPYGVVTTAGGEAAFRAVEKVIELAMKEQVDATVTGPLNKEAMNLAGFHYSGHTEIYAEKTGTKNYSMMLADGALRVVHISTHVSLSEACKLVEKERELTVIRLADKTCRDLGIDHPRIGVAGLNPHCGEGGLFGKEEINEITPAVLQARSEGIDVDGPLPPDSAFSKANGGLYDIMVAQYHDQGHIPLKVLGFQMDPVTHKWNNVTGVNITLGLPIIRSAVDHGTAFDQAGKNTVTEQSMVNALEYGIRLANVRNSRKIVIQKKERR